MKINDLITESMSSREVSHFINSHPNAYYDRESDNYTQLPSEMTDKRLEDENDDDPKDGFYTITYIDGFQPFINGAYGSVEDAIYRTKRIIKQNGGNVTYDANFLIIEGYKEAYVTAKKLGAKFMFGDYGEDSPPDFKPIL